MDLKVYYTKVKEVESEIKGPFAVVASMETSDGGKAGVMSEVTRLSAARQIAEHRARLATDAEAKAFHASNKARKLEADGEAETKRLQFVLVPSSSKDKD